MAIAKIAYIQALPHHIETLKSALLALEVHTRAEPGCRAFHFYQALSTPGAFVLIEHFASEDALEQHLQAPHTRHFFAQGLLTAVQAHVLPLEALPQA